MKLNWILPLFAILLFASCNKDDDNGPTELSIEEQNIQDDGSIQTFLREYHFDDLGRVVKIEEDDTAAVPLSDIAYELSNGVWYAKNNAVTAEGPKVTDIDHQKILLNYDFRIFSSGKDEEGNYTVNSYSSFFNTINTTGIPTWKVPFYRATQEQIDANGASYYEMPGFRQAIIYFNSTEKNIEDPYVFQGVIILPSRASYGRENNYLGSGFRNLVSVINFELYQVEDDE